MPKKFAGVQVKMYNMKVIGFGAGKDDECQLATRTFVEIVFFFDSNIIVRGLLVITLPCRGLSIQREMTSPLDCLWLWILSCSLVMSFNATQICSCVTVSSLDPIKHII